MCSLEGNLNLTIKKIDLLFYIKRAIIAMVTHSSRFRNPKGGILMEKQKVLISGCNGTMGQLVCKAVNESDDLYVLNGFDKQATVNEFPVYSDTWEIDERSDIIIDFSKPEGTKAIAEYAYFQGIPIVIATTGLDREIQEMIRGYANRIPIFQSANFSPDMHILKNMLRIIAPQLADTDIEISEIHHNRKTDCPSGTADMLADTINEALENQKEKTYGRKGKRKNHEIGLSSIRGGNVTGEHTIYFFSAYETLKIEHIAYSRKVFAEGAVKAARFLLTKKPGFYGMEDLFS